MIDDSFSIERDVAAALRTVGVYAVPGAEFAAMTPADAELVADVIRQRDLYHIMALSLEASRDAANARAERAERDRSILAIRCAEQAKELARLLTKHEPPGVWPAEDHPIHAAIATMQRGGLR